MYIISFFVSKFLLEVARQLFGNNIIFNLIVIATVVQMSYIDYKVNGFFDRQLTNMQSASILIIIWISSNNLLGFLKVYDNLGVSMVIAVIGSIAIIFGFAIIKKDRLGEMFMSKRKTMMEEETLSQIQSLLYWVLRGRKKSSFNNLMVFTLKHIETCDEKYCDLNKNSVVNSSKFMSAMIEFIEKQFTVSIIKFKGSISLRIWFIVFLIEVKKQYKEAIFEISKCDSIKKSIDEEFKLFNLRSIADSELSKSVNSNTDSSSLGLQEMNKLNSTKRLLIQSIKYFLKTQTRFLNLTLESKIEYSEMSNNALALHVTSESIKSFWKSVKKYKIHIPNILIIYSNFIGKVLLKKDKSKKLSIEINKIIHERINIYNNNFKEIENISTTLGLSITKKLNDMDFNFVSVNRELSATLEYEIDELNGSNYSLVEPMLSKNRVYDTMASGSAISMLISKWGY